jgi:hypothetical protein
MKPLMLIVSPVATRSGYGGMSRDFIRHILSLNKFDVLLASVPWGACPMNVLIPGKDDDILSRILTTNGLPKQPDVSVHIGVPNEAQPIGKYNILFTAGIETTVCSPQWIMGMNKMDLILATSEHSKNVLMNTIVEEKDNTTGQTIRQLKLEKPIEVLHNYIETDIFKHIEFDSIPTSIKNVMTNVNENFNFLFVGHWLQGDIGEDRKNVGLMIKIFCDTFKNTMSSKKPALILKTSGANFSILDRADILRKIGLIREHVGMGCPNVYLIHGDLTDEEMNGLYNHPKIKAHINLTKGEGFCKPLLEFTQSQKPIIASAWSGHLDFLNKDDSVLIGGQLKNVDAGAVWEGVILAESQWFNFDIKQATQSMQYMFKKYDVCKDKAKILSKKCRINFSSNSVKIKTDEILTKYIPPFAQYTPLKLPEMSGLPQLAKIE